MLKPGQSPAFNVSEHTHLGGKVCQVCSIFAILIADVIDKPCGCVSVSLGVRYVELLPLHILLEFSGVPFRLASDLCCGVRLGVCRECEWGATFAVGFFTQEKCFDDGQPIDATYFEDSARCRFHR